MPLARSRVHLAVSAAAVCIVLSACSVGAAHSTSTSTSSPITTSRTTVPVKAAATAYITTREVDAQPADSPARAVMDFWQDIQLQDFPGALGLLTPAFARSYAQNLAHFATYVSADQLRWMVRPTIESTNLSGQSARVLVEFSLAGTPTPDAFDLMLVHGKWLVSYNFYLINRLTAGVAGHSAAKS
jgi:hypothetical protein